MSRISFQETTNNGKQEKRYWWSKWIGLNKKRVILKRSIGENLLGVFVKTMKEFKKLDEVSDAK